MNVVPINFPVYHSEFTSRDDEVYANITSRVSGVTGMGIPSEAELIYYAHHTAVAPGMGRFPLRWGEAKEFIGRSCKNCLTGWSTGLICLLSWRRFFSFS